MATSGVYQILNTVNAKRYIGSSKDVKARLSAHVRQLRRGIHHSLKLQRAWIKYGADAFQCATLVVCEPIHLTLYEQVVIDHYQSHCGKRGYNVCPVAGTVTGRRPSEETKRKIGAAHRGRPKSQEQKEKSRLSNLGQKRSDEARRKMSRAHKGVPLSEQHRAALGAARRGKKKPLSPEAREKQVQRNKNMVFTAEVRAKMSEKTRANAAATRGKRSAALKRYYQSNPKVVNAETRAKMRAAQLGKRHTEQAKAKMRATKAAIRENRNSE